MIMMMLLGVHHNIMMMMMMMTNQSEAQFSFSVHNDNVIALTYTVSVSFVIAWLDHRKCC